MRQANIKVGLTLLAAILLAYITIAWGSSSGMFEKERAEYRIHFEQVDGLMLGDPVEVRGYELGKVGLIRVLNDRVEVKILLNAEIEIFSDATAEIQLRELMGGKQLALFPGSRRPLLSAEAFVRGKTSADFSSTFSRFGEIMDGVSEQQISQIISRLDTITLAWSKLSQSVDNQQIEAILDDVNASTNSFRSLIHEIEKRQMFAKMDSTLISTRELTLSAQHSLAKIDGLSERLSKKSLPLVDSISYQMLDFLETSEKTLLTANEFLEKAKDSTTLVGKMFSDPEFSNLITHSFENLNKTLDHIRLKKIHVMLSLSKKNKTYKE